MTRAMAEPGFAFVPAFGVCAATLPAGLEASTFTPEDGRHLESRLDCGPLGTGRRRLAGLVGNRCRRGRELDDDDGGGDRLLGDHGEAPR